MSDQQETGASTSLEEVFLSREFGRVPSRGISTIGGDYQEEEAPPPQLEQVFLAAEFGHPEAVTASMPAVRAAAPGRPTLVVLPGGAQADRDSTRYRAIAAVSGVAAAALVVAGLAAGTGHPANQPTQSAQGPHTTGPTNGSPGSGGPGQSGAPEGGAGAGQGILGGAAGSGRGGTTIAQLTSATTPSTPEVVVEVPPGTPVEVIPTPGGTPGGSSPGGTAPGGGILTPILVVVGDTVASLGTTVTVTSNDLGNALPVASPVTGLLGGVGSTVTGLGQSVAGI